MLTLEDAIAAAKSNDWSFLEKLEERFGATPEQRRARELSAEKRKALTGAAAKIFATPEGQLVAEWLLDQTWRRFTFAVMAHPDPSQATLYGAFREGQNAIALTLFRMIAEGRGDPPPAEKE